MHQQGIAPEGTVWAVARALGSQDTVTARTVEQAEDQHDDDQIRRRVSAKELRDAMRAPFR
ncbi:hypothetical protein G7068_03185 [Leucobacter viscericola]|uniref:Uncharacterized protein n=1 Tax=Leucobacter viscericola TaxID=2714935 RepID=A0A6G7XD68_9MICO|nr:hypothetical protein [Leucobacter viscericola]QIK62318.1 hypothetical protein G7068_03185 [Leucobacter viscericola]